MNRACITETINAMETAYLYILVNVPPGTKGKLKAVEELRQSAQQLFVEYANYNIPRSRNDNADLAA